MIQKREIFTGNMDLKNYEILGMKKGQIDINIKKEISLKHVFFKRFQWTHALPLTHTTLLA